MKNRIAISAAIVLVAAITVTLAIVLPKDEVDNTPKQAQVIPAFSYLEQARRLSEGEKSKCLQDTKESVDAVAKDDVILENSNDTSRFDLAASGGIIDVPAGTNFELTINSYKDKVAKGTIEYEKGYGTYNYSIKKLSAAGEWEFVSMIACDK